MNKEECKRHTKCFPDSRSECFYVSHINGCICSCECHKPVSKQSESSELTNNGKPHKCDKPGLHNTEYSDDVSVCSSCLMPVDKQPETWENKDWQVRFDTRFGGQDLNHFGFKKPYIYDMEKEQPLSLEDAKFFIQREIQREVTKFNRIWEQRLDMELNNQKKELLNPEFYESITVKSNVPEEWFKQYAEKEKKELLDEIERLEQENFTLMSGNWDYHQLLDELKGEIGKLNIVAIHSDYKDGYGMVEHPMLNREDILSIIKRKRDKLT